MSREALIDAWTAENPLWRLTQRKLDEVRPILWNGVVYVDGVAVSSLPGVEMPAKPKPKPGKPKPGC